MRRLYTSLWSLCLVLSTSGELMIQLLKICLINPGTDRVMCTAMRKNRNFTDQPELITCPSCKTIYDLNVLWWADKKKRLEPAQHKLVDINEVL